MKIPKLMTQSPENIRTDGALLEQDPEELLKSRKRVEEDGFKLIRPEQAYSHFSQASKVVNVLDVEVLQALSILPSIFLHEIPDVASPFDWKLWDTEGYSNLIYMAVHASKYDQSSFATIKEAAPEEEEDDEDEDDEDENEEELESSEIWGIYPVIKSKENILVLKTVMSPLTVFPASYLFEEYFPKVLQMRFGMPEKNSDYAYWIENNMEMSYLKMILLDSYKIFDRDGPEAGLEVANQRIMLSSSVVRNVTATKSSIFSEQYGTFSPMKELMKLPLKSGDRVFMSLALGGGKSTELHVAQCESVMDSMCLVAREMSPEFMLEMADVFWDGNTSMLNKIERTCSLLEEILESDNTDLLKAAVKDARPKCDTSEWTEKDKSIYEQIVRYKVDSAESRRFIKIYFWRLRIQKFVDRVNAARKKASWTGTLMEMTLTKDSSRLTESKVPWVTFLDVINFIEFWRDHEPTLDGEDAFTDPRIFNMLPDLFKKGLYHDLRVIHVANNEELDSFVKTYTMFDLDSSTVQALNSNNVSGLSKDESILMEIPCPVVTAQRRNWNSTEFFGSRMQMRISFFDERASTTPTLTHLNEIAYCYDTALKLFGDDFLLKSVFDTSIKTNIYEFRLAIFNYFYGELKESLHNMIKTKGKKKIYVEKIESILKLAAIARNYPEEEYLKFLDNHFDLQEKIEKEDSSIPSNHVGLRKLCLSSSEIAVDCIFDIINNSYQLHLEQLKLEEEEGEDEKEDS